MGGDNTADPRSSHGARAGGQGDPQRSAQALRAGQLPGLQVGPAAQAFLFSYADGGKRRCMYVAPGLVPTLQEALCNGRAVEAFLHQAGPELIRQWRTAGRQTEAR